MEGKRDGRENQEWVELGALNVLGDDGGETRGFIQTGVANLVAGDDFASHLCGLGQR